MKYFARTVALYLATTLCKPYETSAFDSKAHDIVEAQAYLNIMRGTSRHLARVGPATGAEVIGYLVAHRAMDVPQEVFRARWQVLGNLPKVRSGDMDFVLSRQFSDNGQAFHFMATKKDLVRTRNNGLQESQTPPHLLLSALVRCRQTLSAVFDNLVTNCAVADGELTKNSQLTSDDFYALVHSIVDSYSRAHVQRTPDNQRIEYLKPWTVVTWHFRGYSQYQHHAPDEYDKEFFQGGLPARLEAETQRERRRSKKERRKNSVVDCTDSNNLNAYQYSPDCLSDLAKEAQDAVEDFVVTAYLVIKAREDGLRAQQALARPSSVATWQAFQQRHFSADTAALAAVQKLPGAQAPDTVVYPEKRPGVQAAFSTTYPSGFKAAASIDLLHFRAFSINALGGVQMTRIQQEEAGLTLYKWERTFEYGVGFRLPLTETFSVRINPIMLRKSEGNKYTVVEAGAQIDWYPNWQKINFFRFETPQFSYTEGYFYKYLAFGIGWDFGRPTGVPLYALGARRRTEAWNPKLPSARAIASARLGRSTTKIWWLFQGEYGPRGTAGNFSLLGGELTWDRNGSGERTGTGYGVMGKMAYQIPAHQHHDQSFLVFQVGPAVRVSPFGLHLLFEPLTYTRALTATAPPSDIRGVYRREDVQSTAGIAIPVGSAEFLIELARYSYGDHMFMQRPWVPAGFRLGYAF